jgi:hypothetical protein
MSQNTLADLMAAFQTRNALSLSQDDREKVAAWLKADAIPGQDQNVVRRDFEGRVIRWDEYGKKSTCGWEKDHIVERVLGGPDILTNFRARHWLGNSSAGGQIGAALALAKAISGRPR